MKAESVRIIGKTISDILIRVQYLVNKLRQAGQTTQDPAFARRARGLRGEAQGCVGNRPALGSRTWPMKGLEGSIPGAAPS